MKVKNVTKAAIVIDGQHVIAPLADFEIDDNHKGVLELIESGHFEVVEAAKLTKDPQTVEEIKAQLTELGIEFADNAKKADLLELLKTAKGD